VDLPLAGLRVAVTMPPVPWFGGVDYNFAVEMADEIRALGAAVFEVEVYPISERNELYVKDTIAALRSFQPDVAVSLPNSSYVLRCDTSAGENLFADILQIPVVMLWDHGLLQFPKVLLDPLPHKTADATAGCIERLRNVLHHPLFFHYSPDRGHIEQMGRLGLIDPKNVRSFLQPAYPNFLRYGYARNGASAFSSRVAFAGNVYIQAAEDAPFRSDARLAGIEERVLAAKKSALNECLWDLLLHEIDLLDAADVHDLKLDPDSTFFWSFMYDEIEYVGNTEVRLHILKGLNKEVEFFGNFEEPHSVSVLRDKHKMRFRKNLDYFTELPLLFQSSDIIVDVVNLGYNSGISPKIMGCFACGGLVLFDYKHDFATIMGEAGDQVMYHDIDHLNTLVDRYLSNPRQRLDVIRYLQHRVCSEFSFGALCKRILVDEPAWAI
jgi:hypothetical protein